MSNIPQLSTKAGIREWLVPPLLVQIFFGLLIIVAVLVRW